MAITKEVKQDKIEIVTDFKHIQVREQTIVKEDDVIIFTGEHYIKRPSKDRRVVLISTLVGHKKDWLFIVDLLKYY